MSSEKILDTVGQQLEKVKEFRYFALLGSFVFFLDFSLIVFHETALSQFLTLRALRPGEILIFFTTYAFFISFVVPLVRYALLLLSWLVPASWSYYFYYNEWKDVKPKDYFYAGQLHRHAVKANNAVAYQYHQELMAERRKDRQLDLFCLALLLAMLFDAYAYVKNDNALFSFLIGFFDSDRTTVWRALVALALWALCLFCFYRGVLRGGGLVGSPNGKIYFPDHGLTK